MNTETLTVHPKGDDFEIIVQHDQTGSAYGTTLSKSAYEQLRLHFVSSRNTSIAFWVGFMCGMMAMLIAAYFAFL